MRNLLIYSLVFLSLTAVAQDKTLEEKKEELKEAQAHLDAAKAAVDALKAEVKALTPVEPWEKGAFTALNFNSLGLTNWAAGGVNSNSITALGNVYANYKEGKIRWENNLDLAYGLIQNAGESLRKNEDKIDLSSKAGIRASNKLNYAVLANLKTQFAPGFDFTDATIADEDRQAISKFFAPAFILASVGADYRVTDYFSIYASPATGKFTIVADDSIAAQNIYIPATLDKNGNRFYSNAFRAEFGALVNMALQKDLTDRINLRTILNLFNNYTDINRDNRKNIDVDWQTTLNMKLTEYIGASLFTHVIHDNDIAVPLFNEAGTQIGSGPRTQLKRLLGVGFSYKF
jgi:hypothetical protein